MEINSHLNAGGVARTPSSQPVVQGAKAANDNATFENAAALENSLRNAPDTRDDVVAMAKELVNSVEYPPPETIRKLSNLLAINLMMEKK